MFFFSNLRFMAKLFIACILLIGDYAVLLVTIFVLVIFNILFLLRFYNNFNCSNKNISLHFLNPLSVKFTQSGILSLSDLFMIASLDFYVTNFILLFFYILAHGSLRTFVYFVDWRLGGSHSGA